MKFSKYYFKVFIFEKKLNKNKEHYENTNSFLFRNAFKILNKIIILKSVKEYKKSNQ